MITCVSEDVVTSYLILSSTSLKSEKQIKLEQERQQLEQEKAQFEEWKKRFSN